MNTNEKERLEALKEFKIMDTGSEIELDGLVKLAAAICETPIALISLIDENRQWFKSALGMGVSETPRHLSFCQYAIRQNSLYIVEDAIVNPKFSKNPFVTGEPNVRFYAGAPLTTPEGYNIGTLCVIDSKPKQINEEQKAALSILSRFVMDHFELKKTKRLLEESRLYYQNLVENASDIIYTANEKGEFTYVSNAIRQIGGYEPSELIGKHFTELVAADYRENVKRYYEKQFLLGKYETLREFPMISSAGEIIWIEQTVVLLMHENKSLGFHGIVRNISERKILEKKLIEAKDLAEKSGKAKEQFLANMSHEIRTPMNAVLGFADLLKDTKLNKEQKEYVGAIETSGNNLMAIINDILDYSKIEAGMLGIEKVPMSIRSQFHSIFLSFKEQAEKKKLKFEFEIDKKIPELIKGDPSRLTQIMINLLGNALKFTEKGGIKINASLLSRHENDITIRFCISDTGIGIPADQIESIFERFNQGSNDTTRKFGGTGLGLSIVKKLVDLQKGKISVKSSQKGSAFIFDIPYTIPDDTDAFAAKTIDKIKPKKQKASVLLVEDNVINQKLTGKILSNYGYKVSIAALGKVAIERLKKENFDIILMDIQMPELNGYEVAKLIRKKLKKDVPIMAMTANAMPGERERCIAAGMNDYIAKPFKKEDLYLKMVSLLNKKGIPAKAQKKENVDANLNKQTVLNLSYLEEISEGNTEFVEEVLQIFIKDAPESFKEIFESIRKLDLDNIKQTVHKLRSTLNLLGISNIETLFEEWESIATHENNMPRIKELYSVIQPVFNKAIKEAKELLKQK